MEGVESRIQKAPKGSVKSMRVIFQIRGENSKPLLCEKNICPTDLLPAQTSWGNLDNEFKNRIFCGLVNYFQLLGGFIEPRNRKTFFKMNYLEKTLVGKSVSYQLMGSKIE